MYIHYFKNLVNRQSPSIRFGTTKIQHHLSSKNLAQKNRAKLVRPTLRYNNRYTMKCY